MKKIIRNLLIVTLVLLVGGLLCRNIIGIWVTERTLTKITGLSVKIKALDIKLTFTGVTARQITMLNPEGYREKRAMEIALLDADFDPFSFLRKEPHFKKITLDIPVVVAVRNAAGEINLKRLQTEQKAESAGSPTRFKIDEFVISLGEVQYINEGSDSSQPMVYKVNAKDRTYRDLSSPEDVKKLVMNLIITSLPENLLGLSLQTVSDTIKSATDLIKQATDKPLETLEKGAQGVLDIFGGGKKE